MEVILKQDVPKLGDKGDIIKVKKGYGINYLIPKGYAVIATESAKKMHTENMRQRAHKEEKLKDEAVKAADKMKGIELKIAAKTSTKGKIFGSVNTIQIAEALAKAGFEVDRKNIHISEDSIKEVGSYIAMIKLHKEVKVEVNFEVFAE
ncbi:MAG: 50S ribosomal protein L9 [Bacteroidota bacterium]